MDTRAILLRIPDGWALELGRTPEAGEIFRLFGTTALPLPLTTACAPAKALTFALTTDYGRRYGVREV